MHECRFSSGVWGGTKPTAPLIVGPSVPDEQVLQTLKSYVSDSEWRWSNEKIQERLVEAGLTGVTSKRLKRLRQLRASLFGEIADSTGMTEEDALFVAVRTLKLQNPSATAKEVHSALAAQGKAAELPQVKKVCGKVTKSLAQTQQAGSSGPVSESEVLREKLHAGHTADNACKQWADLCAWCGVQPTTTPSGLQSCAACGLVRYCSKECQTAAWTAGHKRSCGSAPPRLGEKRAVESKEAFRTLSEFGAADASLAVDALTILAQALTTEGQKPPNLAAAKPIFRSIVRAMEAHPRVADVQIFGAIALMYVLISNDPLTAPLTDFDAEAQMRAARALRIAVDCISAPPEEVRHAHRRARNPADERRGFAEVAVRLTNMLLQYIKLTPDDPRNERPPVDTPADALRRREVLLEGSGGRQFLELIHLSFSSCKVKRDAERKASAMWALFFLTVNFTPVRSMPEIHALRDPTHPASIAAHLDFVPLIISANKSHPDDEGIENATRCCMDPENAFVLALHGENLLSQ